MRPLTIVSVSVRSEGPQVGSVRLDSMEHIILSKAVLVTEVLDKDAQRVCLRHTSEFKWMILMLTVKQNRRGTHSSASASVRAKDCLMIRWQSCIYESESYFARRHGLKALQSAPFSRKSPTIRAVRVDECDNPSMLTVFHESRSKVLVIKELGLVPLNTIKAQVCIWRPLGSIRCLSGINLLLL